MNYSENVVTIYPGGEQVKAIYVETYKKDKIYELIDSAYKYAAISGHHYALAQTIDSIKGYIDGWTNVPEQDLPEEPLALITEDEAGPKEYPTIAARNPDNVLLAIVKVAGTDEYKVKWIKNGVLSEAKSYYTDDYNDAVGTANLMADEVKKAGFNVEIRSRPHPASNPGEPVIVKCPLCDAVVDIPQYNSMDRTDALIEHLRKEHGGR